VVVVLDVVVGGMTVVTTMVRLSFWPLAPLAASL
jgi:hypothetical protein